VRRGNQGAQGADEEGWPPRRPRRILTPSVSPGLLRRLLPYTTVLTVLAALYTAWAFYSRHQSAAEADRQVQQEQIAANQRIVDRLGGDQLKILGFNAAITGEIPARSRVVICYGVSNAVEVKIEPEVEPIKPALSHCL